MEGLTFQQAPFTVLCVSGTQKIFQSPKKARAVISQKKKRAQICKAKMYLVNVSSLALDASNKCKKYSSALWWPLTHMIYNTFLYLKSEYKTKIWECCLPFRLHFFLILRIRQQLLAFSPGALTPWSFCWKCCWFCSWWTSKVVQQGSSQRGHQQTQVSGQNGYPTHFPYICLFTHSHPLINTN